MFIIDGARFLHFKVFFLRADRLVMKIQKDFKDLERLLAAALLLIEEIKSRPCKCLNRRIDKPNQGPKLLLVKGGERRNNLNDKV